jgi:hypothetical protein
MPKISAILAEREGAAGAQPWVAFEYFPPRTAEGVANLYKRFKRMATQSASQLRPGARLCPARASPPPSPRPHPSPPLQSPPTPT